MKFLLYDVEIMIHHQSRNLPDDVDRERKQYHLSDEEFQSVFGMTKDEFEKKPQGKQNWLRKQHNLF